MVLGIARMMGLACATVRKYAVTDALAARLPHGPGPSLLDPHMDYLLGPIGEGCENAIALWRELRVGGYLADVITHIVGGHPQSRLDELMPWAYPTIPGLKAAA